jgi:repressor LexA
MIDAMVADGDIVVLRRQNTAQNGDMVAVWLSERGETTLKKYFAEGKRVRLQPANPLMDPIYVDADQVNVQGRVLAILRTIH